ncbi:MAG: hypothetical protein DME28_07915 [Verrucomicrobia bacterium]|nr:MAG: hypothetical protein DME41_07090 [Verrucomicrobiota bacterium]PYL93738.1 MAG: hypothetical protein DME28_07915 [Verrucomicrobiota bacterium]
MNVAKIMRRYRRMKKKYAAILMVFAIGGIAFAQESPSPTETASASPEQTPSPSPSASGSRNVQLRFVPPPMEGTISLGIFDSSDKLVRVLHRESKVDNFTIDENSLKTTWDGKNDAGEDLPTGKYRARGYAVGRLKVDDLGKVEAPPNGAVDHVSVKLVTNPLVSDTRSVVDLTVGFDGKGSFLKTMDGLPLATVKEAPNLARVSVEKEGEKAANIWQDDGSSIEHVRVSNIDKMMAFDCGFFELK